MTRARIETFQTLDVDVDTRTIWMGSSISGDGSESGVDAGMAERFIKNLFLLNNSGSAPITVLMNNPGGDEIHGWAIADAVALSQSPVIIKVFGHAMSMGSIILQYAHKRLLAPNASVMIHYGTALLADSELHAMEQQTWSRECLRTSKKMEGLYLQKMKEANPLTSLSNVKKLLRFGHIFTPEAAVKVGLADGVLCPHPLPGNRKLHPIPPMKPSVRNRAKRSP